MAIENILTSFFDTLGGIDILIEIVSLYISGIIFLLLIDYFLD